MEHPDNVYSGAVGEAGSAKRETAQLIDDQSTVYNHIITVLPATVSRRFSSREEYHLNLLLHLILLLHKVLP